MGPHGYPSIYEKEGWHLFLWEGGYNNSNSGVGEHQQRAVSNFDVSTLIGKQNKSGR